MAKSSTKLCPVDLSSDVPPKLRHLVAKSDIKLVLVDLDSDVPPRRSI